MPRPPLLPCGFPRVLLLLVERRTRDRVPLESSPTIICVVRARQPFFVQHGIPRLDEPLEQWQEVPVRGLDGLAFLQMCAKVSPSDPDLQRAPRGPEIRIHRLPFVRIVHEGNLDAENARVSGQSLPARRHADSVPVPPDVAACHLTVAAPSLPWIRVLRIGLVPHRRASIAKPSRATWSPRHAESCSSVPRALASGRLDRSRRPRA